MTVNGDTYCKRGSVIVKVPVELKFIFISEIINSVLFNVTLVIIIHGIAFKIKGKFSFKGLVITENTVFVLQKNKHFSQTTEYYRHGMIDYLK